MQPSIRLPLRNISLKRLATATCRVSLFLLFGGCLLAISASGGELRAGLAKIEITPTQPVMLAGYESRKELSKGVHDPLFARALVLDQDGARVAVVSIDNLGFYNQTAEPLRKEIIESCGLKPSELLLCAIHTHSAPTLVLDPERGHSNNVAYTRELGRKLSAVVQSACRNVEPVTLGFCAGSSPVGVNRREPVTDKNGAQKIILGRNPAAATDREVEILKLARSGTGALAGVLFDYQTHSTSLGPGNYLVSGDIHGLAAQFVEKYFGSQVIAPEFAGASGNIDPWVRVLPDFRTNNGWIPEPVLLGTMLGEEVARVSEKAETKQMEAPIKTAMKVLELPAKQNPERSAPPAGSTVPIAVTVAGVGDIAFVGWGGEVFNEIGSLVKAASPFRHTFILTHCNGAAGYLPIRSAYREGGYEVQSSPFAAGAAEQLAQETLVLLREVHEP